jgi:hypothetical protein
VTHSGEIGFLASALVLATFAMKDMINLRIVAICSNVALIAYALARVLQFAPRQLRGWRWPGQNA